LGDADIERFLTYLAVERGVAAATQSIALNAIVFVKKKFLEEAVGDLTKRGHYPLYGKLLFIFIIQLFSPERVLTPLRSPLFLYCYKQSIGYLTSFFV